LLLAGLAALVLLIACANLANMLLVRAAVRRREMAVRLALGAARGRVVRQLLAESLLLAAAGGMAGVLIAQGIMAVLGRFRLPGNIPIAQLHVGVDLTMLAVVVGVSGSTALVFGLLPAVQASGVGIVSALNDRARTTSRNSLRGGLIAAQVALSLTLLVWSALFVRGVERALGTNLGFRSQGAAVATVNLGLERYGAEQAREFYLSSLERIEQLPAVRAAAWARMIPMRGVMMSTIDVDGYRPAPGERVYTDLNYVLGRYFEAIGLPLIAGRTFTDSDRDPARLVAIVSRSTAARYWNGRSPLGGRFRFDPQDRWVEVVGVVEDARTRGIDQEPGPIVYLPFLQHPRETLRDRATVIARADGGAQEIVGTLVRELQAVAPRLPIAQAMTLEDHVRSQVLPQRLGLTLFGSFGLLAVAIAAVGIHGVAAYVVTERTRELGIRMALGAASRQVILLVQRQTLVPVGAGLGIGLIASIWVSRLAGSLMFGLDPHDPAAFAAVVVLLTIVAALAAWFPARRAARVDPTIALRHE
jgi:predicted permease